MVRPLLWTEYSDCWTGFRACFLKQLGGSRSGQILGNLESPSRRLTNTTWTLQVLTISRGQSFARTPNSSRWHLHVHILLIIHDIMKSTRIRKPSNREPKSLAITTPI